MDNIVLFKSKVGDVTKKDLYNALIKIKANECDYLFIIKFWVTKLKVIKKRIIRSYFRCI